MESWNPKRLVLVPRAVRALPILVLAAVLGCGGPAVEPRFDGPTADWPSWGRDPGGQRWSPLDQIDRDNVHALAPAWVYRTGHSELSSRSMTFQATPILVAGNLVFCTPLNRVIALDPETGGERWSFDPAIDRDVGYANQYTCRGVSQWRDPQAAPGSACATRILTATNDGRLIAIDAGDGSLCAGFGAGGEVDLKLGVGDLAYPGEYQVTSPPAIFRDLVVTGSAVGDNSRIDAPSGVVRAYDARDGALRWAWDPLPPDLEAPPAVTGGDGAWHLGTPNVWAAISVDEELGLVYLPTGNPSPDYYGGLRGGSDTYGSSVVALDGATGEVVWSFQTVHHDLWDFDVPAQPTLVDLPRTGGAVPALVQATKMG
ncbi:MAG: PQQ-binding-like beta-propeller repeat protein, partial [Thermoanaerobaculia bacterium]|nr:PQQ-binding-like beta-propeller repeat protein [Thermoanaerobaculia bacterium]